MSDKRKHARAELPVTVQIQDLNNLGCGVGRLPAEDGGDGLVIFVKGAVTGDVVRAEIIKRTSSFAVGRLVEVVTPSPMRETDTFCNAPEACGGCVYRHLRYEDELTSKHARVVRAFRQAGEAVEPLVHHVPHAHGQVVPVSTVDGDAFKAVAVVGAGLLTGAVIAALPHLLQKLLLDLPALFLASLLIQLIRLLLQFFI